MVHLFESNDLQDRQDTFVSNWRKEKIEREKRRTSKKKTQKKNQKSGKGVSGEK